MAKEITLEADIKTRVLPEWKERLKRIASQENLEVSDIVRRALSEFMDRRKRTKKAA